jgi:hypothetical protein
LFRPARGSNHGSKGPVADGLTPIGQIAILVRMAGAPVKAENSWKAEIEMGWGRTSPSRNRSSERNRDFAGFG